MVFPNHLVQKCIDGIDQTQNSKLLVPASMVITHNIGKWLPL